MKKFFSLIIVLASISAVAQQKVPDTLLNIQPNFRGWAGWRSVQPLEYGINIPYNIPFENVDKLTQEGYAYVFNRPAAGSTVIEAWILQKDANGVVGEPKPIAVTVSVPPVSWGTNNPQDPNDPNRSEFDKYSISYKDMSGKIVTIYPDPVVIRIYKCARYIGPRVPGAQNVATNWTTTEFRTVLSGALL